MHETISTKTVIHTTHTAQRLSHNTWRNEFELVICLRRCHFSLVIYVKRMFCFIQHVVCLCVCSIPFFFCQFSHFSSSRVGNDVPSNVMWFENLTLCVCCARTQNLWHRICIRNGRVWVLGCVCCDGFLHGISSSFVEKWTGKSVSNKKIGKNSFAIYCSLFILMEVHDLYLLASKMMKYFRFARSADATMGKKVYLYVLLDEIIRIFVSQFRAVLMEKNFYKWN